MRYDWFNKNLFDIIPNSARRILDVGCDTGLLGIELKKQDPSRFVAGIELDADAAEVARQNLDAVYIRNAEQDSLDDIDGEFDAIILGDVIEHLIDPLIALEKLRMLLADHGELYTSIPNIQHYSIFRRLLKGDFQYRDTGLLDSTHMRFYCLANIDKLFLDAGFLPRLQSRIVKKDEVLSEHLADLISKVGVAGSNLRNMEAFQFQHIAKKSSPVDSTDISPLTLIVHTRYTGVLKDNFYSSPILGSNHPHQVLIYDRRHKLAAAWNAGLAKAVHSYVVLVREDVYLPKDWDKRLLERVWLIEQVAGDNWIAGASGNSLGHDGQPVQNNALVRPGSMQYPPAGAASPVQTLDDAVIVMPKSRLRYIDESLGDFFQGADLALTVRQQGGGVYSLNNPCLDNSPFPREKSPGYDVSKKAFVEKWRSQLPVASAAGVIRPQI